MTKKPCNKCGEVLDLSCFHANKRLPGGRVGICKICRNTSNRQWAKAHAKQEAERARRNAKLPHSIARMRSYNKRNPEKYAAHLEVTKAIKRGELAPASACECADCGVSPAQTLHHHSYKPEHQLDVIPLCRSCHGIRHAKPELFSSTDGK